jgi:hypothetical protein
MVPSWLDSILVLELLKMAKLLALSSLLGAASAYVAPVARSAARTVARAEVEMFDASTMDGVQEPTGFWDPLGFSKTSPQALAWYRAVELKHGRVAMLACTGFIVQGSGVHFSGALAKADLYPALSKVDVGFADLGAASNPVAQWAAMPDLGKYQIISTIFLLELYAETRKPHYLKGGPIGRLPLLWDPVGQLIRGCPVTDTLADDKRKAARNSELTNGRLAMIGAMGFSAASTIEGSVPFFTNGVSH